YYDPRGNLIRTTHPNGAEEIKIYGYLEEEKGLNDPHSLESSPWEVFTYDVNDNAGRTHALDSKQYDSHWDTPFCIILDCLGRQIQKVERNGHRNEDVYVTKYIYDIRGNVIQIIDASGRLAFSYLYDLLPKPHKLKIEGMDNGKGIFVFDAFGNEIE